VRTLTIQPLDQHLTHLYLNVGISTLMVLAHSTTHTSIIVTIRSMPIQGRTSYMVTDLQAQVLLRHMEILL